MCSPISYRSSIDRESSPVKDRHATIVPCSQLKGILFESNNYKSYNYNQSIRFHITMHSEEKVILKQYLYAGHFQNGTTFFS